MHIRPSRLLLLFLLQKSGNRVFSCHQPTSLLSLRRLRLIIYSLSFLIQVRYFITFHVTSLQVVVVDLALEFRPPVGDA